MFINHMKKNNFLHCKYLYLHTLHLMKMRTMWEFFQADYLHNNWMSSVWVDVLLCTVQN